MMDERDPEQSDAGEAGGLPRFEYEDRLVDVGTAPEEVRALADAIVRGAWIVYARIADLRAIVDAVMAHPGATLAPAYEKDTQDDITATIISRAHAISITKMILRRSLVEGNGSFRHGDRIRCTVDMQSVHFDNGRIFEGAIFCSDTMFQRSRFLDASFQWAKFCGRVRFEGAQFVRKANFVGTAFRGGTEFWRVSFDHEADFLYCKFVNRIMFDGATFGGPLRGDLRRADVRGAIFGEAANVLRTKDDDAGDGEEKAVATRDGAGHSLRAFLDGVWRRWRGVIRDARLWLGWHRVRSFGELAILNRVSLVALIAVPLLAAAWPVVDLGVRVMQGRVETSVRALEESGQRLQEWNAALEGASAGLPERAREVAVPTIDAWREAEASIGAASAELREAKEKVSRRVYIGASLVFAFFAAMFVTLGRLVYQAFAPPLVQKFDEDAFVDDMMQRYARGDGALREDGLRRATEALARIASVRPDRHANLVSHHGETVWIPPKEWIEWFEDQEEPKESEPKPEHAPETKRSGTGAGERGVKWTPAKQLPGFVPGEERARIALEEGARAEYWLLAREVEEIDRGTAAGGRALRDVGEHVAQAKRTPAMAVISLAAYVMGIGCLAWILGLQTNAVIVAGGRVEWSRWFISVPLGGLGAVMIVGGFLLMLLPSGEWVGRWWLARRGRKRGTGH